MIDDAPLAWSRALAFGIVAGGMGVLGHDLVARTPTEPATLAAGIAFAALVARPLAPLRIGVRTMVVGLALLQTVIHLACIAVLDATPDTAHAAAHAHAHIALPGADPGSGGWQMLFVHIASLLLGSAVLLTLEQHAWAGARRVARRLVGAVRRRVAARRTRRAHGDPRFDIDPTPLRAAACRIVVRALGTRGPPARRALPA